MKIPHDLQHEIRNKVITRIRWVLKNYCRDCKLDSRQEIEFCMNRLDELIADTLSDELSDGTID